MTTVPRRALRAEVWIVLGLSLGQSAVYAVVSLVRKALSDAGIGGSTATLNPTRDTNAWLDLLLNVLSIGFALVPVALALYLLAQDRRWDPTLPGVRARLGLGADRPGHDLAWGALLAAVIGLPGLGVYFLGRELGVTADVVASDLSAHWWTVPVLVLSALQNSLLEEVVVVGYLFTRLRQLTWGPAAVVVVCALLRGSYHLYQGLGQGLGNVAMGLLLGWFYLRTGRLWPLIVAHTILDVVAFVGYALLADTLGLR